MQQRELLPDLSPFFADCQDDDGWETLSESSETSTGDWEEQLVFLEFDDISSVQEIFVNQPNEFIRFKNKQIRFKSPPSKETSSKVKIEFHNVKSSNPIVRVGERYYKCHWEDAMGSAIFFRKRSDIPIPHMKSESIPESYIASRSNKTKNFKESPSNKARPCAGLRSLHTDPSIPYDTVFGKAGLYTRQTFEMVAVADRLLKAERMEATTKFCRLPSNYRSIYGRLSDIKVPIGYTVKDLLAGRYKPRRRSKFPNIFDSSCSSEESSPQKYTTDDGIPKPESSSTSILSPKKLRRSTRSTFQIQ